MAKYKVETRKDYADNFDNWIGDCIEADSEEEAVELAKQWLIDNDFDGDPEELEYKVTRKVSYLVEYFDKKSETTLQDFEFDTLEEAKADYERICKGKIAYNDAKSTIIILSQIDENGEYEEIQEYDMKDNYI